MRATVGRRFQLTTLVLTVCLLLLSSSWTTREPSSVPDELAAPFDVTTHGEQRGVLAQEPEWLDGFPYRKPHTIHGSLGADTNYQVEIEIRTGYGPDAGNLVYLPSELWSPSDTVRFTDDDGVTLLDYWRECTDAESAVYWVEVKDSLDYDAVIYLYYGNSTQSNLSNGTATFLFFDDFENGNLNRWNYVGSRWNVTAYDKKYGSYSAYYDGLEKSDWIIANLTSLQSGIMIHCWYKPENALRGGYLHFYTTVQGRTEALQAHDFYWQYWNGSVHTVYGLGSRVTTPEHWDRCELAVDLSSYEMKLWINRTYIGAAAQIHDSDGNNISQTEKIYCIEIAGQNSYPHRADDYYVRKWISAEPVNGDWGLEEDLNMKRTWYNDCSNLTAFNGTGDNTWPHNSDVSVTFGSVKCSGTYFYCDDVGSGTGHHGPLYYATLATPFTLAQFIEVRAEIEIDATSADRRGWIRVGLHAPDNVTILTLQVADPGTGVSAAYANAVYRFINGTTPETPQDYPAYFGSEPYHESFAILKNSSGLYSSYPGIPNASLLESSQIESNRIVKYVSIQFNGYDTGALCETMRIHDITLEYSGSEPETLPVISLTSPGNNTVRKSGSTIDVSVSGWHTVLYRWDTGSNNSWAEPFQVSLPSGEALHVLYVYANNTLGNWTTATFAFTTDDTVPTLDTPSDIEYNESTTGHSIEWHPSDLHPASYTIYHNSLGLRSGIWNSTAESILVSVDGLAAGTHNYTVVVIDAAGNAAIDTVFVTVLGGISTGNYVANPGFETGSFAPWVNVGGTGYNAIQTATVYSGSYALYLDSHYYGFDDVEQNISGIVTLADYPQIVAIIYPTNVGPTCGQAGVSAVFVVVENTATHVKTDIYYIWSGYTYPGNDIGANLTWAVYNLFTWTIGQWNTLNRSILADYTAVLGAPANPSLMRVVTVALVATSSNGDPGDFYADDICLSGPPMGVPSIDHPSDVVYTEGQTGYTVSWSPMSSSPSDYEVFRDGTSFRSGIWNCTGETILVSLDGLEIGIYNYTVVVGDTSGNTTKDTVFVTVQDGFPSIDTPSNIEYDEGTTGNIIQWQPTDLHPDNYTIYHDSLVLRSGTWNSTGEFIRISVDGLAMGTHNYTLVVRDVGGNTARHTVFVTALDATPPNIDTPSDVEYDEGTTGHTVHWHPTDLHPANYTVYRNSLVLKSGTWNSTGETILISVDGFAMGVHNHTVEVTDLGGNRATHTVLVTVLDGTPPTIDSPSDISYTVGESGLSVVWGPGDAHPQSYSILRNGTVVDSGDWNGSELSIVVDGLAEGGWNYTLVVTDMGGNTAVDTVLVRVLGIIITTTPDNGLVMALAASGGGIAIVLAFSTYVMKSKSKGKQRTLPPEGVQQAAPAVKEATIPEAVSAEEAVVSSPVAEMGVEALRGGEFVGNRFRFKVKVANHSKYIVSDVAVAILSYPSDSLRLDGEQSKSVPRIDPEGFRSPTFEFTPTQDCVKGNLIASVSFVDYKGQPHSLVTKPFTVRAVCDLLIPETITAENFLLRLSSLDHGDQTIEIKEWTPEEMHEKTVEILKHSNFYEVTSESRMVGEHIEARVAGWAKGKYTGKNVGVEVVITGKPGVQGAKCKIHMSGEDEAMLMPAIDEIAHKLSAWLCPRCGGALPQTAVNCLKSGKSACCPFCGVTMDR